MIESIKTLFADAKFTSIVSDFTLSSALIIIFSAMLFGFMLSLVYIKTGKNGSFFSTSFAITLVIVPIVVGAIIMIIGNNFVGAISLAGAFSVIRFRSVPGDPKDLTYVFFALAIGVTCGTGYPLYGFIFTLIVCILLYVLWAFNYAKLKTTSVVLKINIPENLNFTNLYDDVLPKYAVKHQLVRIKTKEFGAVYELMYTVILKNDADRRTMLDEIRCRNGNLTVTLTNNLFEEKLF